MRRAEVWMVMVAFGLCCGRGGAAAPILLEPANGAQDQPSEVTLQWQAGSPTNLVLNGSFEAGRASWTIGPFWGIVTSTNAYAGMRYLELPPQYSNRLPGAESLFFQEIRLPARGAAATLSWVDHTQGTPLQAARLKVEVSTATTWEVVHDVPCGENTDFPWGPRQVDLTPYLGRTVVVAFVLTNRSPDRCYAAIDDIRLEVAPADVSYQVYVGSQPALGAAHLVATTWDTWHTLSGLASGSTNYWKITQTSDGLRATSPVFRFVVGGVAITAPWLQFERVGDFGQLRFPTQSGVNYSVEESESLDPASWQGTGDWVAGDGLEAAVTVALSGAGRCFRVLAQP